MQIDNPVRETYDDLLNTISKGAMTVGQPKYDEAKIRIQLKSTIDVYNKLHNLVESLNSLPGKLSKLTDETITSNEKMSKKNEQYMLWQNVLTGVLAFATFALVGATVILAFWKR